jgi:hypothetical protein
VAFGNDALMGFISRYPGNNPAIRTIDSYAQFASTLHEALHALVSAFRNDQNPTNRPGFFG